MYDLVGNPEDRFSRAGAQMSAMKKTNWWPCTCEVVNHFDLFEIDYDKNVADILCNGDVWQTGW